MSRQKPNVDEVISAVIITLDAMCEARGIEFEDLDETTLDKLLCAAYREHLSGDLIADYDLNVPDS